MFTEALFTTAKMWKQPKCPSTDEWINKCGIFIQWGITQPLKRKKILTHDTTWVNLEDKQ